MDTPNIARVLSFYVSEHNGTAVSDAARRELSQLAAAEARAASCDALLADAAQTICDLRDERESLRRQLAEALVRIAELERKNEQQSDMLYVMLDREREAAR